MLNWLRGRKSTPEAKPVPAPSRDPAAAQAAGTAAEAPQDRATRLMREGNAWLDKGDLQQARQCFRQASQARPGLASAWVNLGYVLAEQQDHGEATMCLQQAVALDPANSDAHYMLGAVARKAGNIDAAIDSMRRALELKADFVVALRDLCMLLACSGRADAGLAALENSVAVPRESALYHLLRGNMQVAAGNLDDAEHCFLRCAALAPGDPSALVNLGIVLLRQHRTTDALARCREAVALDPLSPQAQAALASVLLELGQWTDAATHTRKALDISPDVPEAHVCLGRWHAAEARMADAIGSFQHALALDPLNAEALARLGEAHAALGQHEAALNLRRKAVLVNPADALAHNHLGMTCQALADLDGAIASYRRALEIDPKSTEALSNLGSAHMERGKLPEALSFLNAAVDLNPDSVAARSSLLFALTSSDSCTAARYLEQARCYGQTVAALARPIPLPKRPGPPPGRALRIGLVSGDLRQHPVGRFLESTLASIDRSRLELVAYSNSVQEDDLTSRLKPHFSGWHVIGGSHDEALAALIRAHRIDVLVDLAGHTAHNRLPLFAWRAAPVQASWLGYWASTGVAEMDFILVDPISVPPGAEAQFTERPWHLPQSRMCFTPPSSEPLAAAGAAQRNGFFTFGTFQVLTKINDGVLALWSEVLRAAPKARLRVQSRHLSSPAVRRDFLHRLDAHGIAQDQVDLHGGTGVREYLAAYSDIDLVLDTFPFTGGTTTCEALWMGVPTLTLQGESLVARQGASLMMNAGLPEFVALTREDYVRKAVTLASDGQRPAARRDEIRRKVSASTVFNAPQFARQFEEAMIGMWRAKTCI